MGLERISYLNWLFLFYLFSFYMVSDWKIFQEVKKINELRTHGGLKMSIEMIIAVSVMVVVFIVVSWIMQKNKSKKSWIKQGLFFSVKCHSWWAFARGVACDENCTVTDHCPYRCYCRNCWHQEDGFASLDHFSTFGDIVGASNIWHCWRNLFWSQNILKTNYRYCLIRLQASSRIGLFQFRL